MYVTRKDVTIITDHPGKDYMNLHNFRIVRAGARGRRGAAEGAKETRILPSWEDTPRGIRGRTRSFFLDAYPPSFIANFPAAVE